MRIAVLVLVLSVVFMPQTHSQNVYDTHIGADITINFAGAVLLGTAYALHAKNPGLKESEVSILGKDDIWKPERFMAGVWKPRAATASDVFLYTSLAAPAPLLAGKEIRKSFPFYLAWFETMLLNSALTNLTKEVAKRKRPFVYGNLAPLDERLSKDATASMFSGHTSFSASACFFTAKVYSDFYPDSKYKPYIWSAAAVLPAVTGFLRVRAGKHFPTDVLIGYMVGAGIGVLVPHLHARFAKKQNSD